MSTFNETITLTNARDAGNAKTGLIPQSEVRAITVDACVDTGAWALGINEEIRQKLGLELDGKVSSTLADGSTAEYDMTEGVEFRRKDSKYTLSARLIPTAKKALFGALPMESLDLMADPAAGRLVGRHGDTALYRVL